MSNTEADKLAEQQPEKCGNRTSVDSGALILALNVLRRAGKYEAANALEETATREQTPAPSELDDVAKFDATSRSKQLTQTEATLAMYDALHTAGFKRVEDWFIRDENTPDPECIHIDTLTLIARAIDTQATTQAPAVAQAVPAGDKVDAELPPIDEYDLSWLTSTKNTGDIVDWIQHYARAAIAAGEKP